MNIPIEYTGNGAIVRLDDSMGGEPTIIRINAVAETVRITVHRVPRVDKFRRPLDEWEVIRREAYTFDSIADASPHIANICGDIMDAKDWGMNRRVKEIQQNQAAKRRKLESCLDF